MAMFMYAFMGLMIAGAVLTPMVQRQMDAKPAVLAAMPQADQYRMFMLVANSYMATYSGGPGVVTWDKMKLTPGMPSGAARTTMPSNWRVVVANDMSWVACTQMDERAVGMVQQIAVPAGLGLNNAVVNGQNYVVIGGAQDAGKASQCM